MQSSPTNFCCMDTTRNTPSNMEATIPEMITYWLIALCCGCHKCMSGLGPDMHIFVKEKLSSNDIEDTFLFSVIFPYLSTTLWLSSSEAALHCGEKKLYINGREFGYFLFSFSLFFFSLIFSPFIFLINWYYWCLLFSTFFWLKLSLIQDFLILY